MEGVGRENPSCLDKLPAELLTNIATALPLEEAARTSVLSRRWQHQWRVPTPNRHSAGKATTKFMANGYPISCFETVDEFLLWADQVIDGIEVKNPVPLPSLSKRRWPNPVCPQRRHSRQIKCALETQSKMRSKIRLGLNFKPEDPDYGWIEISVSEFNTTAWVACDCYGCLHRAVSFLRPGGGCGGGSRTSLGDVFSGTERRYLLQHLALLNCDMETLRRQVNGDSFRSLKSLLVQTKGDIDGEFLTRFIYRLPSLTHVTLEDCAVVNLKTPGRLIIPNSSVVSLRLTRCSGVARVFSARLFSARVISAGVISGRLIGKDFDPLPPSDDDDDEETVQFRLSHLGDHRCYDRLGPLEQEEDLEQEENASWEDKVAYKYYAEFD